MGHGHSQDTLYLCTDVTPLPWRSGQGQMLLAGTPGGGCCSLG